MSGPMKVLLEMRPALAGHAGIPQATRLLFREASALPGMSVEGLLQSSNRVVNRGLPVDPRKQLAQHRRIDRLSRVLISLQPDDELSIPQRIAAALNVLRHSGVMLAGGLLGLSQKLTRFEPEGFEDFVWRHLFSRTLGDGDFELVTRARHRIARVPWIGHARGRDRLSRKFGHAVYPRLDTRGVDVDDRADTLPGTGQRVDPARRPLSRRDPAADAAHHLRQGLPPGLALTTPAETQHRGWRLVLVRLPSRPAARP